MPGQHTEYAFETAIEHHLTTAGGYVTGDRDGYDPHRAIFPADVLAFIKATQPDEWAYLEGIQKGKAEETLLDDLCRALDSEHEGCLSVLRHGFKCFGKLFHVAYFAPASGMNPETKKRYEANRLTITRQRFGAKFGKLSEDEVQAVVTACVEGQVSNARMREITDKHAADLTRVLQGLVQKGFLTQDGQKRWATYRLRETNVRKPSGSGHLASDSTHKRQDSTQKADSTHNGGWDSSQRIEDMGADELQRLKKIALPAQMFGRLPRGETKRLIEALCRERFLTAAHFGELMSRSPEALRARFLKPMVAEGVLRLRYPSKPNRPDQAYTVNVTRSEDHHARRP